MGEIGNYSVIVGSFYDSEGYGGKEVTLSRSAVHVTLEQAKEVMAQTIHRIHTLGFCSDVAVVEDDAVTALATMFKDERTVSQEISECRRLSTIVSLLEKRNMVFVDIAAYLSTIWPAIEAVAICHEQDERSLSWRKDNIE